MNKFEENEIKKIRPIKTLVMIIINYIPEPIRKSIGGFNDKQTVYGRGKKLKKSGEEKYC